MSAIAAVSATNAARPRGRAVVGAPVEIDIATAREFEREAMHVLDASDGRIVIDLSATTFIDVSGARVIARVTRRASELGGSVSLAAVGPGARRLLDLVEPAWASLLGAQDDPAFKEAPVCVSTDSNGYPETERNLRVVGGAFDAHPSPTLHCDGPPAWPVGAAPGLNPGSLSEGSRSEAHRPRARSGTDPRTTRCTGC